MRGPWLVLVLLVLVLLVGIAPALAGASHAQTNPWRNGMVVRDHTPFPAEVAAAVREWDSRMSNIAMDYQNRGDDCAWRNDAIVICHGGASGDLWGRTTWRFSDNGEWTVAARIVVYETCPEEMRFALLRHELGHALRLGHTPDRDDVMYAFVFAAEFQTFTPHTCAAMGRQGYGPRCDRPEAA